MFDADLMLAVGLRIVLDLHALLVITEINVDHSFVKAEMNGEAD